MFTYYFAFVTSIEWSPLFRGKGHFFCFSKPGFNLLSEDTLVLAWASGVSGEKGKDGSEKNFLSPSPLGRPDTQATLVLKKWLTTRRVDNIYCSIVEMTTAFKTWTIS